MKDFGRWLAEASAPPAPAAPSAPQDEPVLPEGIYFDGTEYTARCCRCDRWGPLWVSVEEIPAVGYEHYCGGSPLCCP